MAVGANSTRVVSQFEEYPGGRYTCLVMSDIQVKNTIYFSQGMQDVLFSF